MAAPPEITIKNLTGKWVMNKTLSDDTEPVLAMQGMNYFLRKGLGLATITMHVNALPEGKPRPTTASNAGEICPSPQINIIQLVTGGIRGTTENRTLDWSSRSHTDHIFGTVSGKSRYFGPSIDVLDTEMLTKVADESIDPTDAKFLKGEINSNGSKSEGWLSTGPDAGQGFVVTWADNEEAGWTAEMIWGFEVINGKRMYTRRAVVRKNIDGKVVRCRMVYDYIGPVENVD